MKEAILYDRLKDKRVRCDVSRPRAHPPGRRGYCNTRLNRDVALYFKVD